MGPALNDALNVKVGDMVTAELTVIARKVEEKRGERDAEA